MDFLSKNFEYVTRPFGEFMNAIERDEKLYLRSLAADKPSELPADLKRDFPTISADFQLPPELSLILQNAHSSPLRISGPVSMWLHYDVLFLPSLWLHTASPTEGISVAVNVFFRNLKNGYAVGKDVYGNRDLQAYEKGRQDVNKIAKSFENLPLDVQNFYLQRLAEELKYKASSG